MFHLNHHQPNRRMSKSWSWTLDPLLKYSSLHPLVERHDCEVTSPLRPPLPGKAVRLFLLNLAKTVVSKILSGEFVISLVLSRHSKNLKQRIDQCYSSMLQLSSIGQAKEKTSSRSEGGLTQKTKEKPSPPTQFGSSFYVFSPPSESALCNWASREGCFFDLRSSLLSSDLPLFYFPRLFPSLSFSHRHYGLLFPILTT